MLERIEHLWNGAAEERALEVAWFGGFSGFTPADLVRGANIEPTQTRAVIDRLKEQGKLMEVAAGSARRLLLHADILGELDQRILAALGRLHDELPLMASQDRQKVQSRFDYVRDDALVQGAVDRLIQGKKLVGDLRRIARADHKPKLSGGLRKLKDKLIASYQEQRFQPPDPGSFAGHAGGNAASLADLMELCVAEGHLVRVTDDIYLHAETEAAMRRLIGDRLSSGSGLTVAEIRDLFGTTRKYAVPLCEYLDRIGLTRREGDLRFLAQASAAATERM
jgi:selenocysteine-specific elongation factor